jgi:hypothetical protein
MGCCDAVAQLIAGIEFRAVEEHQRMPRRHREIEIGTN